MSTKGLLTAIFSSLNETSADSLHLPMTTKKGKNVRQTISEYYREWSAKSYHTLVLEEDILVKQFKDLLTTVDMFKNSKTIDQDCLKLATAFKTRAHILSKTYASKAKFDIEILPNGNLLFKGDNSIIFDRIREFVNAVTDSTAYNVDVFVKKVLNINSIDTTGVKFGFDIGHMVSNVISAYGAISINAIRRNSSLESWKKDEKVKEQINFLYDDMLNNPKAYMSYAGMSDYEVYKAAIEATVGVTKRFVNGELNIALNIKEKKLDRTMLKKIAQIVEDKVIPEAAPHNQAKGAGLESAIGRELSNGSNFLKLFAGISKGKFDLLNLESSDTGKDIIEKAIRNILKGKKDYSYKSSNSANFNTKNKAKISPNTTNQKLNTSNKLLPKIQVPKLRNLQGQFTSLIKLEALMRAGLQQTIIKNMHRPNLRNQTGRFAKSVELNGLSRSRDGAITAFLSYMRYPYATFEEGGKQGHKGYSPTRLIDQSARELASKLVNERFRTVVK